MLTHCGNNVRNRYSGCVFSVKDIVPVPLKTSRNLLVNYKSLVIKRLRWKLWRWKMSNNQSRPAGKHRTPEVFTSMLDVSRQAGIRCSVSVAFFKPLGTSSSFNPRFSLARRSAAKTARIRGAFLFIRVHSRAFAVLFFFFGCG